MRMVLSGFWPPCLILWSSLMLVCLGGKALFTLPTVVYLFINSSPTKEELPSTAALSGALHMYNYIALHCMVERRVFGERVALLRYGDQFSK